MHCEDTQIRVNFGNCYNLVLSSSEKKGLLINNFLSHFVNKINTDPKIFLVYWLKFQFVENCFCGMPKVHQSKRDFNHHCPKTIG